MLTLSTYVFKIVFNILYRKIFINCSRALIAREIYKQFIEEIPHKSPFLLLSYTFIKFKQGMMLFEKTVIFESLVAYNCTFLTHFLKWNPISKIFHIHTYYIFQT